MEPLSCDFRNKCEVVHASTWACDAQICVNYKNSIIHKKNKEDDHETGNDDE